MYKNTSPPRPGTALIAVAIAQFVIALDMAIMNVALPSIGDALGFAPLDLAWVVHIYALTFGGFLLLGGKACDLYGRRRLFTGGLVVFGIASLAGGFAQESWQLVAARAVQGIGAAAIAPAALATLTSTFPHGQARVRALGVWGGVNAAGGALGVLAGGLLTEYANWRWVMLVNLPIVAVALLATAAGVAPDAPTGTRARLDIGGAVLATCGVGLLVTGVIRTDHYGWTSTTTGVTLGGAVVLLAGFIAVESRSASPLLRLGLFTNRWVVGGNLFVFCAAAGQFAAFYLVSLYMQRVLQMSPGTTGTAFIPFSLCVIIGTLVATRAGADRSPRPLLISGALLTTAGIGWFALISPGGSFLADVLGPSIVGGLGLGLCLAPVAAAAVTGVDADEAGMAAGAFNSARQLGGSVGVAVLATVAAANTGASTDPLALNSGYAVALVVAALLFATAALVAATVLPGQHDRTKTLSARALSR